MYLSEVKIGQKVNYIGKALRDITAVISDIEVYKVHNKKVSIRCKLKSWRNGKTYYNIICVDPKNLVLRPY